MMEAVETTCCADMHANIDITAQLQHSLVNEVFLDAQSWMMSWWLWPTFVAQLRNNHSSPADCGVMSSVLLDQLSLSVLQNSIGGKTTNGQAGYGT